MCKSKAWRQTIASNKTHQQRTKPHSPWGNWTELHAYQAKHRRKYVTLSSKNNTWITMLRYLQSLHRNSGALTVKRSLEFEASQSSTLHYFNSVVLLNVYLGSLHLNGWYNILWFVNAYGDNKLKYCFGLAYWLLLPVSCNTIICFTVWSLIIFDTESHTIITSIKKLQIEQLCISSFPTQMAVYS